MRLRSAALSLALASLPAFAFAADNNSFVLVGRSGKSIGKASYTIDKMKDGVRVKSHFEYRLGTEAQAAETDPANPSMAARGRVTDAQFTAEYKVDTNGNFQSGFTQNSADQKITSFQPSKTRDSVTIGQMQGGVNLGSRTLNVPKPDFLLASDYDPGAVQVLLTVALAHPHTDSTYLLIVPGSGPAGGANAVYVQLQPPTDANGTLDGKPVALKHYVLKYANSNADVYADADGTLMEADMASPQAKYVRTRFALSDAAAK